MRKAIPLIVSVAVGFALGSVLARAPSRARVSTPDGPISRDLTINAPDPARDYGRLKTHLTVFRIVYADQETIVDFEQPEQHERAWDIIVNGTTYKCFLKRPAK